MGSPTFRVKDKIFVMAGGSKVLEMTCKAAPGAQDVLVRSDPAHFFVPAYVGHRGWVGVRIDRAAQWSTITDLAEQAYRMTAPKRIAALLPRISSGSARHLRPSSFPERANFRPSICVICG